MDRCPSHAPNWRGLLLAGRRDRGALGRRPLERSWSRRHSFWRFPQVSLGNRAALRGLAPAPWMVYFGSPWWTTLKYAEYRTLPAAAAGTGSPRCHVAVLACWFIQAFTAR